MRALATDHVARPIGAMLAEKLMPARAQRLIGVLARVPHAATLSKCLETFTILPLTNPAAASRFLDMNRFKITLRFEDSDGGEWVEVVKIKAANLNDADNVASRMQVERDADAVSVEAAR